MSEPLWSDERINAYAWNASTAWEARHIYDAMRRVRDEYETWVPLPAPDGIGWWAYENDEGMNRCVGWVYKDARGYTMHSSRGMLVPSRMKGKWYRLRLPWGE